MNRGKQIGYPKQQQRAAPSRWRRYGPTKYIYEAGGWIGNAKARKKDYKFIKVKKSWRGIRWWKSEYEMGSYQLTSSTLDKKLMGIDESSD